MVRSGENLIRIHVTKPQEDSALLSKDYLKWDWRGEAEKDELVKYLQNKKLDTLVLSPSPYQELIAPSALQ